MMKAAWTGLLAFVLGMPLQYLWIEFQRRRHMTQAQKAYGIGIDADIKARVPTMGGVVFLAVALFSLAVDFRGEALVFWALPISCGLIGFADDYLKFRSQSSEGFTSLRKLAVQVLAASAWILWFSAERKICLWPGVEAPFWFSAPLTLLATVAMVNAVNVTDGLDGLAGGAFMISLGVLGYLLPPSPFTAAVFAVLFGTVAAFLVYNVRPARTFMGDTGSHFLGGALVALCVHGDAVLALIPAGFLYGIELLSSALQIAGIRGFKKKIFLIAPLHHHFQRMGWDETTVTMRFLVIHAVGASFSALFLAYLLSVFL